MGAKLALVAILAVGCSSPSETNQQATVASEAAVKSKQGKPMTDTDNAADACVSSLKALASGKLADFAGLDGCTRAHADAAFDVNGTVKAASGDDSEVVYPGSDALPSGITVRFKADRVTVVKIRNPEFSGAPGDLLGEPDAKIRSGLGAGTKQWVYIKRGLAVHYRDVDNNFKAVVAFEPTTVEAYEASDLANIERARRIPLRGRH